MSKRYQLTARAQMHGEVREPGYFFTLEDGEKGPHRGVGHDSAGMHDVPLYREAPEEAPAEEVVQDDVVDAVDDGAIDPAGPIVDDAAPVDPAPVDPAPAEPPELETAPAPAAVDDGTKPVAP